MARWQILLIKSFGVGLGIAVGVGLIFSGYLWWTARPKPDKPWNDKVISASYLRVSVTDDSFFSFYYFFKKQFRSRLQKRSVKRNARYRQ